MAKTLKEKAISIVKGPLFDVRSFKNVAKLYDRKDELLQQKRKLEAQRKAIYEELSTIANHDTEDEIQDIIDGADISDLRANVIERTQALEAEKQNISLRTGVLDKTISTLDGQIDLLQKEAAKEFNAKASKLLAAKSKKVVDTLETLYALHHDMWEIHYELQQAGGSVNGCYFKDWEQRYFNKQRNQIEAYKTRVRNTHGVSV